MCIGNGGIMRSGRPRRSHALLLVVTATFGVSVGVVPASALTGSTPSASAATRAGKPGASGDALLIERLVTAGAGRTRIETEPATGAISLIGFPSDRPMTSALGATPAQAAAAFVETYAGLFGAARNDLQAARPEARPGTGWTVRFDQTHRGLPVAGAGLVVRLDQKARVQSATGKLVPDLRTSTTATVSGTSAVQAAVADASDNWDTPARAIDAGPPGRAVFDPALLGRAASSSPRLAWQVRVTADDGTEPKASDVYVDARTGDPIANVPLAAAALDRAVCDNSDDRSKSKTCDTPARTEGSAAVGNQQVDDAYTLLGQVYDFYFTRFGRDGINGDGQRLDAVVRACPDDDPDLCPWENAHWDGDHTMLFGNGYVTDDITAHEMAHGVTQSVSHLMYLDQTGAINESMSDVFGELLDLSNGFGDDSAAVRWQIGEDLPDKPLRNMADPPLLGDPDSMTSGLYLTSPAADPCDNDNDQCWVHTNSGVGNHAAALMTDGGAFDGRVVRGLGIDKTARIYYEAQQLLTATSRYRDLYNALIQGCANLQAADVTTGDDCAQVYFAVSAVRMNQSAQDVEGTAVDPDRGCSDHQLARNDDASTGRIDLPFPVNFFGNTHTSLYVNNNGNVTFDAPLSTYTPFGLRTNISTPIIAPFFADIDTRGVRSDQVTYGNASAGVFCVNWAGSGVGYYGGHDDKLVRAQLQLIDRSADPGGTAGDFDIVMNYGTVNWETGDASGGSSGLGGSSARAGYSAGTGVPGTFHEFPGSGEVGALLDSGPTALVHGRRDSTQEGRYVFRVRSGAVPIGGGVSGTVYAGSATPEHALADSFVQVCPVELARGCNTSTTNAAGLYQVSGLPAGRYTVKAYPPGTSRSRPGTREVTLAGVDLSGQDVVLDVPTAIPAGTTLTNLYLNPDGLPVVNWGEPLTLRTHGCAGATATYTLRQGESVLRTGPMTEGADGEYTAILDPLRPATGFARLTIDLACVSGPAERTVFDLYIDPSGTVVDTASHPVEGATVTLLRSDDLSGPFTPVPDGSGLMSVANRQNPMTTAEDGHYGWDVVAGYYRVRARRSGCVSAADPAVAYAESAVLTIPPQVTDLRLVLSCVNRAPTAPDQNVSLSEDTTAQIDVLAGTGDPDHDPVTFSSADTPAHGTLTCTGAGVCTYTPVANYNGSDAFTYIVDDGRGGTATGTVDLAVTAVNDLPTAGFSVAPPTGSIPLTVAFDAAASLDVEGIAGYGWAFGDGGTATGVSASHLYTTAGTYHVVLTVTDTSGATDTAESSIVVTRAAAPVRDSLTMDRSGALGYRLGGMLDSGDFVIEHKKGAIRTIEGTGVLGDRRIILDARVTRGTAHGKITVKNARGKVVDRIRLRGTRLLVSGDTISGVSVWGTDPSHLNRLQWSLTDAPTDPDD
jgi:Zn-dependent metalloprotease/PKD repeat protein